jgi:hypothetical protein
VSGSAITAASELVLAHAGHALVDLPVFLGPVLVIIAWLKVANLRDKRRAAKKAESRGRKTEA